MYRVQIQTLNRASDREHSIFKYRVDLFTEGFNFFSAGIYRVELFRRQFRLRVENVLMANALTKLGYKVVQTTSYFSHLLGSHLFRSGFRGMSNFFGQIFYVKRADPPRHINNASSLIHIGDFIE